MNGRCTYLKRTSWEASKMGTKALATKLGVSNAVLDKSWRSLDRV